MDAIIGTGKLSKREYGIISQRNVSIPMSDGITIDVNIFRPDARGKFPALLAISGFDKELQSDRIWPAATRTRRIRGSPDADLEAGCSDFWVRRGYVHVIGSVRGTGRSGGIYNFLSPREVQDTGEVIEWLAKQPWCTGNVGMIGLGYFAAHNLKAATLQPPHLKAIAPMGAFWDNYREFWWPGGVLQKGFLRWLVSLVNLDIHTQESALKKEMGEKGYKEAIARALADKDMCAPAEIVEALKNPDAMGNAPYLDILLHPLMCQYWKDRNLDYAKIKVPVLMGSATHRPGPFYHWSELKCPKKLIFFPPSYTDRPFYQYSWEQLRWFDYWLKGIETGIMEEPLVQMFVRGSNDWLMANDFPFPATKFIPFNLHENRSLCEIEPWPEAESASYDDAPNNRGSLKYYSAPMVENTEVAGTPTLNLYASCRGTDTSFFVGLWDVDPEGNEVNLNRGWLKASHRELDPKLSKPWLPVHTHTNPQPLVPGQVYPFSINIWPTANLFKAGHRIMLKISSADDEPENLYQVGHEHLISQTPNTITVYHSAEYPSHLLLPITRGNIIGTYVSGGDISLKSKEFMKLK